MANSENNNYVAREGGTEPQSLKTVRMNDEQLVEGANLNLSFVRMHDGLSGEGESLTIVRMHDESSRDV